MCCPTIRMPDIIMEKVRRKAHFFRIPSDQRKRAHDRQEHDRP